MNDSKYMEIAQEIALKSYCLRRKIGAVVVRDSQIIGNGCNGRESITRFCNKEKTGNCLGKHAEDEAIKRSNGDLTNATLYTTMRPCADCTRLITESGIKRVLWRDNFRNEEAIKLQSESTVDFEDFSPNIVGVIIARQNSSRFPNKMTAEFGGMPLLQFVIERTRSIDGISLALATTTNSEDDALVALAKKCRIGVYRGSEEDVALRILECAKKHNADYFLRLNGESPFIDTNLVQRGVDCAGGFDVVTNLLVRTFPYGISLEIIRVSLYEEMYPFMTSEERANAPTKYFYNHQKQFNIKEIRNDTPKKYWTYTIDSPEDLERLNEYLLCKA